MRRKKTNTYTRTYTINIHTTKIFIKKHHGFDEAVLETVKVMKNRL